jgi:hypothetical protein
MIVALGFEIDELRSSTISGNSTYGFSFEPRVDSVYTEVRLARISWNAEMHEIQRQH